MRVFSMVMLLSMMVLHTSPDGQTLPGTCKVSWVGNTFGGAESKWVQNFVTRMDVGGDGTVYTNSTWDENGRCNGIYRNGDVLPIRIGEQRRVGDCWCWGTGGDAVAVDGTRLYINNEEGNTIVYDRANNHAYLREMVTGHAVDMTVRGSRLYMLRDSGTVEIRTASTLALESSFKAAGAVSIAVTAGGDIWLLAGTQIKRYSAGGVAQTQTIQGLQKPVDISMDNAGRLMVCDDGYRRQVLFYDIAQTPRLVRALGDSGGIRAGTPGLVTPTKFFALRGAGTDDQGNIYVAMSRRESIIRAFSPTGALLWEVNGLNFVDNVDPDRSVDGNEVYGVDEIYAMDYSKEPGREWRLKAITRDDAAYPADPRITDDPNASVFVRLVNGRRLLYMCSMYAGTLDVYHFNAQTDGYIAIYSQSKGDGWALWPDAEGSVWSSEGDTITKDPLTGFDAQGWPLFGARQSFTRPAGFESVNRLVYDKVNDRMFVGGYTTAHPDVGGAWGLVGTEIRRYDSWSTAPKLVSTALLPCSTWENGSPAEMIMPKSMAVEGDYIFVAYTWNDGSDQVLPPVRVYRIDNGGYLGSLRPGQAIGTSYGWVDIPYAVSAVRRPNREYEVFLEDDKQAKNAMYRWCPTGDCVEPTVTAGRPAPGNAVARVTPGRAAAGALRFVRCDGAVIAGPGRAAHGIYLSIDKKTGLVTRRLINVK